MVFSRVADIVSAAASHVTTSQSPSGPSVSAGLFPSSGHSRAYSPGQRNHLRFSSLQDFSAYRGHDPEEGDIDFGIGHSPSDAILARSLEKNSGGSFSKEKNLVGVPIRKKCVRACLCILFLALLFFLIYLCIRYFSPYWYHPAAGFYVVLDCGSTGTRVYVYESSVNDKKDGTLPIVLRSLPDGVERKSKSKSKSGRAYQRMETEPGFDKLVHNISGLRTAIRPLLQWAEEQIPKQAHKTTSLFLYATAGVRRLPQADSKWLLDNAWSILENSSFKCRRDWVKIISGMEEAYYGWVALNYQMGMLRSIPTEATYGALDLGGSSLQVTFETENLTQDETSLNLSIGAVNHHLNAYSLSGYGLNDAFDKSVAHLLKKDHGSNVDNAKIELKHPCLHSGYKEKYTCSQCASLSQGGSPLISGGSMSKGGKPGVVVELLGTPQYEECNALAKISVNLSEWSNLSPGIDCEIQPCALHPSLPRPRGKFFAMSGFFVVFRFFNLTSEATLDDVLLKGQEFCEKPWKVAKKSVAPQPFIEQYCFRAPYIVSLLREGLHITDGQVLIGSGSITWTLGVALLESGGSLSNGVDLYNYNYRIFQLKMSPAVLFVMVFLSLILLICVISCVSKWIPRFFRMPYIPLSRHSSGASTSVLNIPSPFKFQRWSPINSGDGRTKMPLSPTIAGSQQGPFSMGGFGGSSIQLMESSLNPSSGSVSHSYSSGSLGQMQFEANGVGSFYTPHRSHMKLQSRRSQSREDLHSSLAESQIGKV